MEAALPSSHMTAWNKLNRLAGKDEKVREAAFETQMLASLHQVKPAPTPPAAPTRSDIQIVVTQNGQTITYPHLQSVPASVREKILTTWQPTPPPFLPAAKPRSLRLAQPLNLLFPGAGFFSLGRPGLASGYMGAFLACFVAMAVMFLRGYAQYLELSTSDDLLQGDNLAQLRHVFPTGWLVGLLAAGLTIYLVSTLHLNRLIRHTPPVKASA